MVARLEGRVREGIAQIRQFRALPGQRRDEIISRALGHAVRDIQLVDALLARSCFGTHDVWVEGAEMAFLTLPILSQLTRPNCRHRAEALADFPMNARNYLQEYVAQANPRWNSSTFALGDVSIDVQMLEYDHAFVNAERRRAWAGRPVL